MKRLPQTLLCLLAFAPTLWAAQAEFYVAPSGSDQNPGTRAKPFKSIAHARDQVAKINGKLTGNIIVHLGGGTYEISESLVFDANDSGGNGHKVIYKAFPGHEPIVSGGKRIEGWVLHNKENNIYKASVGDLEFRQIYVNGVRGVRARSPNRTSEVTLEGYLTGAGVTGKAPHQLKVQAAELKGWETWSNLDEVEVVMVTHWKQKRARIAKIEGNMISFQEPENKARSMHHLEQGGTPHWYENAYEFLDAEGEFYLNTKTDTLFYKPREGENLASVKVIVPVVETLFDIRGDSPEKRVSDLVIEGITFEYSNWTRPNHKGYQVMQSATWNDALMWSPNNNAVPVPAAIELEQARDVVIRSCTVRHTGAHGIAAIRDVVSDCTLIGNLVQDSSAGGIYLLLNMEQSTGNQVHDNTVERIGMEYSDGCGILVARTPDVSILHNEVRNVRYTGITTGWSWNDKETTAKNHDVGYNHIHGTMGLHDDGGGIYTLGKVPGMKIHHNYIHDIVRSKHAGNWGICGIYLDNGSCFKLVEDNVISRVEAAFFSGNKPNYKNTFHRNYYNTRLAKIIEKSNTVTGNVQVKAEAWPAEARKIMQQAGPRDSYRRPEAASAGK